MHSLSQPSLHKTNITIKEFCEEYARLIETLIEDSHENKCPKIDANYDDY